MYLRISEEVQVILWDIKHAFHYSSSAHRNFLRSSHGPRSVAGQEPEEDRLCHYAREKRDFIW